jgi:hypothetical protein
MVRHTGFAQELSIRERLRSGGLISDFEQHPIDAELSRAFDGETAALQDRDHLTVVGQHVGLKLTYPLCPSNFRKVFQQQ